MRNFRWLGVSCLVLSIVFCFSFAAKLSHIVWLGSVGVAVAAVVAWRLVGGGVVGHYRLGLAAPDSWSKTVAWAVVTAVAGQVAVSLASAPVLHFFPPPDISALGPIKGHPWKLAELLLVIWTTAAFGEEIVFRGFLIPQVADGLGNSRWAHAFAVFVIATFFGLAHSYQGPAGAILTGMVGLVYGASFLHARRNLWRTILAHGLYDSTAFVLIYFS